MPGGGIARGGGPWQKAPRMRVGMRGAGKVERGEDAARSPEKAAGGGSPRGEVARSPEEAEEGTARVANRCTVR